MVPMVLDLNGYPTPRAQRLEYSPWPCLTLPESLEIIGHDEGPSPNSRSVGPSICPHGDQRPGIHYYKVSSMPVNCAAGESSGELTSGCKTLLRHTSMPDPYPFEVIRTVSDMPRRGVVSKRRRRRLSSFVIQSQMRILQTRIRKVYRRHALNFLSGPGSIC